MSDLVVATDCGDPGEGEVLISVRAFGINRADLLQLAGKYSAPQGETDILGLEVSGIVESCGRNVSRFKVGDAVCALLTGGGYATKVVAHSSHTFHLPKNLSFEQGAAIPEVFITAYLNLQIEGELKAGERILIQGGSSGVGTAAIQLAKKAGADVFCTVRTEQKKNRCLELGADRVFIYTKDSFVDPTFVEKEFDLILDCIGASYIQRHIELLRVQGRLVVIGMTGGTHAEVSLPPIVTKRLRIIGSVLRSRSIEEKGRIVEQFCKAHLHSFEDGTLYPVIDSVYSINQISNAHQRMKESNHIGKLVIRID